jgi:hypothetical protein
MDQQFIAHHAADRSHLHQTLLVEHGVGINRQMLGGICGGDCSHGSGRHRYLGDMEWLPALAMEFDGLIRMASGAYALGPAYQVQAFRSIIRRAHREYPPEHFEAGVQAI